MKGLLLIFFLLTKYHAEWVAFAKSLQKFTISRKELPEPILSTIAEPTTTPSATEAISFAVFGVFTPKPTQTGMAVFFLILSTSLATDFLLASAAPVTPVMDT